jgi:hypothetical protein
MPINPTVVKKTGTLGPITKPFTVRFDPRSGQTIHLKNTGDLNTLLSAFALAQAQGASGELIVSPVLSELSTETPIGGIVINGEFFADYVFDQWEIETNEGSESVFGCPLVQYYISPNDRAVISRAIADGTSLAAAVSACQADLGSNFNGGPFTFTAPTAANSLQLYKEMIKMQDSWGPFTYVLRHTSNVSAQSTYNSADYNVNRLYTPAQLISECTSGWTYPLPQRLIAKIFNIPYQYASTDEAGFYLWSWKKSASREQINAQFRVDIVTEYVLALWSTIRYQPR